jgi:hypothetical protein
VCFVTKWVAVTEHCCCTWRFHGYHETEVWSVRSHCAEKCCYSELTTPSSFHNVCVTLVAPEVSVPSRHFYKDTLTKQFILRHYYYYYLGTWKTESFLRKTDFWGTCVEKNATHCFLTLNDFFNELESQTSDYVLSDKMEHVGLQVTVK